ncbi:MAG: hypothetical protein N2504_00980 [candidate division WOR-3 bacterium]|nr:hypothetical protein [candidate division WOR-3 bacterium]MCX7947148.1 hypothetical protein [candidate division WOR-3 bacterium]MDW8150204.1 hypothetical protein [candidate division WOR-3 bacterium]
MNLLYSLLSFPFPERDIIVSKTNNIGFLPYFRVYGSFSFYPFRNSKDHAWNIRLGGDVVLFSNSSSNFGFFVNMEFISDPYSPIYFHPRAIYFSEGFYYIYNNLKISYIHRCKHDIDDFNRTLILSGPRFSYITENFEMFSDIYIFKFDETNRNIERLLLHDIISSIGFINYGRFNGIYYGANFKMDMFKKSIKFLYGLELGYSFKGKAGELKLFSNLENFYDTGMNEYTSSNLLFRISIGSKSY